MGQACVGRRHRFAGQIDRCRSAKQSGFELPIWTVPSREGQVAEKLGGSPAGRGKVFVRHIDNYPHHFELLILFRALFEIAVRA